MPLARFAMAGIDLDGRRSSPLNDRVTNNPRRISNRTIHEPPVNLSVSYSPDAGRVVGVKTPDIGARLVCIRPPGYGKCV